MLYMSLRFVHTLFTATWIEAVLFTTGDVKRMRISAMVFHSQMG